MELRGKAIRIEEFEAVSFDIFDTLLKRDVYKPTDVFILVQREYKRRHHRDLDFYSIRINAESTAREKSNYPEITLDDIYNEIDISDRDLLKALELEIESNVLHCNYDIKPIYDKCILQRKAIYIVSDMYLPREYLERILQREGFQEYRNFILSSEYRKTKRSGELFKVLVDQSRCVQKRILHIGDSWYADYIGAKKAGINAVHIHRHNNNTLYMRCPDKESDFDSRALFSFINSRISKYNCRDHKLGYEILGPVIYAFCCWIHDQYLILDKPRARLWMAARDMYLFAEAFRILFSDEIDFDYVYISRRSLRPILTTSTGKITESGKAFPRGKYTLEQILAKMGYGMNDLDNADRFDLEKKYNIRKLEEYNEIKEALSSRSIADKEERLAETGILYLKDKGLFDSDIILADVGWHGTTQYILKQIQTALSSEGTVFGLYLGCLDSTDERIGKDNYMSFLFNEDEENDFTKGILLFESLILAPHGSTKSYRLEGGSVLPVLGTPDNITQFLSNVQQGALDFVRDYKNSILSQNTIINGKMASEAFCNMTLRPLKEELNTIGKMDYEDFGNGKMANPRPVLNYFVHPKLLYPDFKHSPWRIGFLYELFGLRLPYARVYSYIRKIQGKKT